MQCCASWMANRTPFQFILFMQQVCLIVRILEEVRPLRDACVRVHKVHLPDGVKGTSQIGPDGDTKPVRAKIRHTFHMLALIWPLYVNDIAR